jgi:hypothetical protein
LEGDRRGAMAARRRSFSGREEGGMEDGDVDVDVALKGSEGLVGVEVEGRAER